MQTVRLHLERLRRHYEVAVHTYDHISLLDLSHSLRIWAEMKQVLQVKCPAFSAALSFKTGSPPKPLARALRGSSFAFASMPGGAVTYANEGTLVSGPFSDPSQKLSIGTRVMLMPDHVQLSEFMVADIVLEEALIKRQLTPDVTRCTYLQWLGAEAVRLSSAATGGTVLQISREMLIKRIANSLDGSHSSAAGEGETNNKFDAPILSLMDFKLGGLPLPYFLLLKIAQDILAYAPKHME